MHVCLQQTSTCSFCPSALRQSVTTTTFLLYTMRTGVLSFARAMPGLVTTLTPCVTREMVITPCVTSLVAVQVPAARLLCDALWQDPRLPNWIWSRHQTACICATADVGKQGNTRRSFKVRVGAGGLRAAHPVQVQRTTPHGQELGQDLHKPQVSTEEWEDSLLIDSQPGECGWNTQ